MREARNEIASFYHLAEESQLTVVCQGMACFVARRLKPNSWNTSHTAPRVYCLGKCYLAPATSDDQDSPRMEVHAPAPVILRRLAEKGARTLRAYTQAGGYLALEEILTRAPEYVIREVEISGLRGRGGAGFPTGEKWRAVATERSTEKFVVANADEGDPGAYIDRFIMEDDPHRLIEALAIAGYAVGAGRGYIYVRAEYPKAQISLSEAVEDARREGFLGESILHSGFSFDLEVVAGRGSYICGEESALLNAIECKRPEARFRPPYPTEFGLFGKPTLINNVETLAAIPWILEHGGEAYHELGFTTSRGTKVVSLNSLFRRPGLYEVEFGMPLREIVYALGGGLKTGEIEGVIVGGPLAGIIPPAMFDTPFGFEELREIGGSVGHGGIIAFDQHTSIPELIHHVFEFGAFESCGKCVPCRLGTRRLAQAFATILAGQTLSTRERVEFDDLVQALASTSLCGLGTGLAEFAESVVRYYRKDLEACFASPLTSVHTSSMKE